MRPRRVRLGYADFFLDHMHFFFSFNEAEARAPRIPRARARVKNQKKASMRPRRVRLGYLEYYAEGNAVFLQLQ